MRDSIGKEIYLDNVIVHALSFGYQVIQLREVFQRFRKAQLQLKLKKCDFFKWEVKFLGHIVSKK